MGFHGIAWDTMGNYRTFMGQSTDLMKQLSISESSDGTTQHLVVKLWD